MKPVRVAICDDDSMEREFFYHMCRKVKNEKDIQIQIRQYESGEALLFHFEDSKVLHSVDIVLLDISMPVKNGVEVAKKLREYGFQGAIIFITHSTNPDHFRAAFDVQAFNYITKDNDVNNRFIEIFIKAVKEVQHRRSKTLIFSSIAETRQIDIDDISHFEVEDHVITVYYGQGENFKFISTLSKVVSLVYGEDFIRVHRSYLVSVAHILSLNSSENSIEMMNRATIPVSKKYKATLREAVAAKKSGSESNEETNDKTACH